MNDSLCVESSEYEDRETLFGEEDEGKRLDAALAAVFPDLSRSRIQSIIENGLVRPAGLTKHTRVKSGMQVFITVYARVPLSAEAEDIPIDVIYEDEDLLVVDKARGMVVHPAKGNISGTLVNSLLGRCARHESNTALSALNGNIRPGIVHRIDKNTSGLLVVAKNDAAHAALAVQFAAHTITRRYQGIVSGGFHTETGTVDAPIGRDPKNRLKQAVLESGKDAVTHWRMLERLQGRLGVFTLLELSLETGRTHQIRVHMAKIGHPLLGDDIYGPARGVYAGTGQYLHAAVLGFRHPSSDKSLIFESRPPLYFKEALDKLRR